jgi:NAD(P)H dehydrogenase (quinone)
VSGKRTLVVYCHPIATSLAGALRQRCCDALRDNGHDVRVIDLHAEGFDPVLSLNEHVGHLDDPSTKPGIAEHADLLRWCDALVFVYPTWWGGQPAMLKGWIDRVFVQGVAFVLPAGAARIRPLLGNINRIAVVTTHGSSKFVNAVEGEPGKRVITRSIRAMCHRRTRTRWIALYDVDRRRMDERSAFIDHASARLIRFLSR